MTPYRAGADDTGGVVAIGDVVTDGGYGLVVGLGEVSIDVGDGGSTVVGGYSGREDVGSCAGDVVTVELGG
ncbi:hypothetical protein GCM10027200_22010 [Lentzea nigeriaca]